MGVNFRHKLPGQMTKLAKNLFYALRQKEKFYLLIWSAIKFFLSFLDILGLVALGILFQKLQVPNSTSENAILVGSDFLDSMTVYQLGLLSISFFVFKITLSIFANFGIARFVRNLEIRKSVSAFRGLLLAQLEVTEKLGEKKLIHGLLTATHNAYGATLLSYFIILGELSLILVISIYLASTNLLLFLIISVIFIGLTVISNSAIGRQISKDARSGDLLLISASTFISDALRNKRQIVSHKVVGNFVAEFEPRRRLIANTSNRLIVFTTLPRYALEITLLIGLVLLAAPLASSPILNLDSQTLAIFAMGLFRVVGSMLPLQNQINLLRRIYEEASASFEIEDILSPSSKENHESLKSPASAKEFRELRLIDVSYSYPGAANSAIRDINASIYKDDFVALVGKSGSGKSTFADILTGLRAPGSGVRQVFFNDGTTDSSLIFGYVPQKITLFSGSLRQNIAMSFDDAEIDEERLSNSISLANLTQLVSHLPEGVGTRVDDSNRGLSGGEVQRVGIARALYAGAEFIVMDESTSALDRASEDAILETLLGLKNKTTVVLIAHRERSVAIADRVLVFENGRILD